MFNNKVFNNKKNLGFSFIEVIVALIVISIAFGAIAGLVATLSGKSANPIIQTQAIYLAEGMLEEVLLRGFEDPDEIDEGCSVSRDLWDNLSDYNCLNTPIVPRSASGQEIASLMNYRVGVIVSDLETISGVTVRRIEVVVTNTDADLEVVLTGWKGLY